MRRVRCHDCGKSYNFDIDDFCPKCGAFNQPTRMSRIGADGAVVRVDGLNERNHEGSFVHAELHEENRERHGTPLSKGIDRHVRPTLRTVQPIKKKQSSETAAKTLIGKIIFAIILINIFGEVLFSLL